MPLSFTETQHAPYDFQVLLFIGTWHSVPEILGLILSTTKNIVIEVLYQYCGVKVIKMDDLLILPTIYTNLKEIMMSEKKSYSVLIYLYENVKMKPISWYADQKLMKRNILKSLKNSYCIIPS